ncbi:hypothetical protein EDD92_8477 [Streptomyces sp. TLI_185]|nr:hypothetical protein EDD92_8477 [Streptomyces sp. TLI_185]
MLPATPPACGRTGSRPYGPARRFPRSRAQGPFRHGAQSTWRQTQPDPGVTVQVAARGRRPFAGQRPRRGLHGRADVFSFGEMSRSLDCAAWRVVRLAENRRAHAALAVPGRRAWRSTLRGSDRPLRRRRRTGPRAAPGLQRAAPAAPTLPARLDGDRVGTWSARYCTYPAEEPGTTHTPATSGPREGLAPTQRLSQRPAQPRNLKPPGFSLRMFLLANCARGIDAVHGFPMIRLARHFDPRSR